MILARHSDEELKPHLSRLLNMDRKYLQSALEYSLRQARKLDDEEWLYWLTEFQHEYDARHAE